MWGRMIVKESCFYIGNGVVHKSTEIYFICILLLNVGNIVVIVLRVVKEERIRVPSLLVNNLAVSDALMGFYMICLAAVDLHYQGRYIENSLAWRSSGFCQFLGVIATMSSEVSPIIV